MEPNYKYARDMAKKILRQHKIDGVPTDLQVICGRLGLEYVAGELRDAGKLCSFLFDKKSVAKAYVNFASMQSHVIFLLTVGPQPNRVNWPYLPLPHFGYYFGSVAMISILAGDWG